MTKKVAILYGWSEGPWHSKKLVAHLSELGYEITKNVQRADVIIAHSLGVFRVPRESSAKLIMLIGLPFWPGKSVLVSLFQGLRHEAQQGHGLKWWLIRTVYAMFYIFKNLASTIAALSSRPYQLLPTKNATREVVLIRNESDHFSHPDITKLLPQAKDYNFIKLPGGHEDWWIHPEKYAELVTRLIKKV